MLNIETGWRTTHAQ